MKQCFTHILVVHVPVRPLSVGHHLPHDNAVAPAVAGRSELPVLDGLWSCPPNGNLSSLEIEELKMTTVLHLRFLMVRPNTDGVSPGHWCRWGLTYRPPEIATGQSRTLCTPGCCWPGCSWLPDLCGRSSCHSGISLRQLSLAASPPTGSLWTGHRFASTRK